MSPIPEREPGRAPVRNVTGEVAAGVLCFEPPDSGSRLSSQAGVPAALEGPDPGSAVRPQSSIRPSSLLADLGSSLLTQAAVVLGNLLTLWLAARAMTPDQVGEFALARRVLVFLIPLLLLGLGVGLPRTLGNLHAEPRKVYATAAAGWLLGMCVAFIASAIIFASPETLAKFLFGGTDEVRLVRPLILMVLGQQAFMVTFAVFRGRLQIKRANVLQMLHAALAPVFAVLVVGHTGAVLTLWTIGAVTCAINVFSAVVLFRSLRWEFDSWDVRSSLRVLLNYGLPRVPGDLANAGIYALGPLLAAHWLDLRAAGMLAIGLQFVTVVAAAFGPLGLVLLPRLSRALAQSGDDRVRQVLPAAIAVVVHVSALMVWWGAGFGNQWLRWVLSEQFTIDPHGMTLLALAGGANVVVVVVRSWNDAAYFRPVNAVNAALALGVQLMIWSILKTVLAGDLFVVICTAIAASFLLQAALTLVAIARRFGIDASWRASARWIAVQVVVGGVVAVSTRMSASGDTAAVLLAQVAMLGSWALMLRLLGERCFQDLLARVRDSRRSASDRRHLGPDASRESMV